MLKQIQAPDRVFGAAKNSALNLFGLYVLEPDLGRLPKAHSDRKGTMGIEKTNLEPGLGRFTPRLNRPKSGSTVFISLPPQFPLVTVCYNQSP